VPVDVVRGIDGTVERPHGGRREPLYLEHLEVVVRERLRSIMSIWQVNVYSAFSCLRPVRTPVAVSAPDPDAHAAACSHPRQPALGSDRLLH